MTEERIRAAYEKLQGIGQECLRVSRTQPGCAFIVMRNRLPSKGWLRPKLLGSDSQGGFYAYDAKRLLKAIRDFGVTVQEETPAE